ncbi:MAG: TIGR02206 family membrane protein [Lachnospiraceae bacterium]|nr:TIGR02206 family membrane protein [Lachnospiraceae bacterium]
MNHFFMFESQLPADSGFPLFGLCHVTWLVIILGIGIWFVRWYCRQEQSIRQRTQYVIGVIMPVIAVYRDSILMLTRHWGKGFLPLHLCGMALWIAPLYIVTRRRWIGVIYVTLCVPGAIGALLFPDWNMYPLWNYMHIHAFVSHGLLVVFGFTLICSGEVLPAWREFYIPVLFGIAGFLGIHWINDQLHTNYWFLNVPSKGSPLNWILHVTGSKWYRVGYFIFCMGVVALWMVLLRGIAAWRKSPKFLARHTHV